MGSHEHDLFYGPDSSKLGYTIQCRKCNNKWYLKRRYSVSTFIFLLLIALIFTILGVVFKNIVILLIAVSAWSVTRRTNELLALLLNHIDLEKVIGEQYAYDFQTERRDEQRKDEPSLL